jgi:phosphate transport system permease protein
MRMHKYPRGLYGYLKQRNRENLLASICVLISCGFLLFLGVTYLIHALVSWSTGSVLIGTPFNNMVADSIIAFVIIATGLPLVLMMRLLLESHYLGVIMAGSLGLGSLALVILGQIDSVSGFFLAATFLVAGFFGFLGRRKTPTPKRDTPTSTEAVVKFGTQFAGLLCIGILLSIVIYVGVRGVSYLSPDFLFSPWISYTHARNIIYGVNTGALGGIGYHMAGSLLLVLVCGLIASPLGLGAGIYLAEYSRENYATKTIRFFIETLAGIPSIVIGLVGFNFFGRFLGWDRSLLAGAISLAFMILPWTVRVAEEAIKSVPAAYREASLALGATKWQTIQHAVLTAAMPGVVTGIILGIGKAIGETAVVWCTAGDWGATKLPADLTLTGKPIPNLPTWIFGSYQLLYSPVPGRGTWEGQNLTLAGSFVLLFMFLIISVAALFIRNYFLKKLGGQ